MGILKKKFILAPYTSWKIGGPAKVFYEPDDIADLENFLHELPEDEPLVWLGRGSNVLIADEGIDATVICTRKLSKIIKLYDTTLQIEAGASCAQLINFCFKSSLTGAEFLAGIPGTIGGALAMNAGAFGKQIWDLVTNVKTINHSGKITERSPKDFVVSYRHLETPWYGVSSEWFIAADIKLAKGDVKKIQQEVQEKIANRLSKQPVLEPSCGSVFRNPANDSAGRLIEACGLKGKQIGGAQISEKHANFIVNRGNATAADVKQLMQIIQSEVKTKFNIDLIPEVKFLP